MASSADDEREGGGAALGDTRQRIVQVSPIRAGVSHCSYVQHLREGCAVPMFGAGMSSIPMARVVTERPVWLVTLCVALSFATSCGVSVLIERRSQRDVDDVATSALEGFDAIDRRLRVVERRCAE